MATKRFYATGDFRYATRMLRAGDPVDMDGPTAKLFFALGKISADNPKARAQKRIPITQAELDAANAAKAAAAKAPRKRQKK